MTTLEEMRVLGFDASTSDGKHVTVKCSACEALVINGIPSHETGCPNAMHECAGCFEVIPHNRKYCSDCC